MFNQYYRHYKGGIYRKLREVLHTESGEKLYVYQHTSGATYARPKEMFTELVDTRERKLVMESFGDGRLTPKPVLRFKRLYHWNLIGAWLRFLPVLLGLRKSKVGVANKPAMIPHSCEASTKKLYGWLFTYNDYEEKWYAYKRDHTQCFWNNRTATPHLSGTSVEELIEAICHAPLAAQDIWHPGARYGTGLDGDIVIDGTVQLTKDTHYNDLTLKAGAVLIKNGFEHFVKGNIAIGKGAHIVNSLDEVPHIKQKD